LTNWRSIYGYLALQNIKPKPFVWSKTVEDIITRRAAR
jgi:hypothetical protein